MSFAEFYSMIPVLESAKRTEELDESLDLVHMDQVVKEIRHCHNLTEKEDPEKKISGAHKCLKPVSEFTHVSSAQIHWSRRKQLLAAHPELKQLIGYDIRSAVWTFGIIVGQLAVAALLANANASMWTVFAVAYVFGACLDHGMWVLVHDMTHDLIFPWKAANTLFHLVGNIPLVFPSTISFRHYHRLHHSYLNETYNDPDMPGPLEARIFGNSAIGKAAWMFLFPVMQSVRVVRYHTRLDVLTIANWAVQIAFCAAVLYVWHWKALAYLTISSFFAIGFHPLGARWIAEHYAVHPDQETYSYYGSANTIAFNIGYHNEHHDLPLVPWSRLPMISKIAPELYKNLHCHWSYTKLLMWFILDRNFTLKTRVIHPSYSKLCDETIVSKRPAREPVVDQVKMEEKMD